MGSLPQAGLPDAESSDLILTHPTQDEKYATWQLNSKEWKGALSEEDYLRREPYMETVPLSKDGGMQHWVLTSESTPAGSKRTVLSSCETLRKRVLVGDAAGQIQEGIAYGVGSVFTDPVLRGNRYGARMLRELGKMLRDGAEPPGCPQQKPIASALWSDIGKQFYAKKGWPAYPSLHVSFAIPEGVSADDVEAARHARPITNDNLKEFCDLDVKLIKQELGKSRSDGKTRFCFAPDYDIMRWHLYRDDVIARAIFKERGCTVTKGAVAGPNGQRVWVLWARNFHVNPQETAKNKLYILRLVIEDETTPAEKLAASFAAVMGKAHEYARDWKLGKIDLWNPTATISSLIEASGLQSEIVERDVDSIPSMMWYGEEEGGRVEWIANEKYCWN
ncbi:hypothetical protein PG995_010021 [Apiospora arundinis]|uniref:LYC1 C-terminal domain-containing protein n=1 Tax=Apiospora arundinis TaxID=335852 RepID=A0ABR2IU18_9PEZI